MKFIIQLEPGWYRACWSGDPGRTAERLTARAYPSEASAKRGLAQARRWRPFPNAVIEEVP